MRDTKRNKRVNFQNLQSHQKEKSILGLIIIIFIIFCSYLALNIKSGVAPDEIYHISVSKAYSKTLLIPENTEETYYLSDITRIPYLSYWINGRVINLNITRISGLSDISVMRAVNIFYSTLTLIFTYLISKLIINKKHFNLAPTFLLFNTLMFTFLSSSISYDNLINLLSVISIYIFIKFLKELDLKYFILLIITLGLGLLTKITIIPLAFIEFLIIFFTLFKKKIFPKINKDALYENKGILLLMIIILLLSLGLYGANLIKYKGITVSCDKILTQEQCMTNGIYSRDQNFEEIKISNLSEFYELMDVRLTPLEYASAWTVAMGERTFGIMGHQHLFMPKIFVNIYIFIFLVNIILIIRHWRKRQTAEHSIIIIILFYSAVLLFYQNYRSYLHRNIFVLALQGRYLFPVLPAFYVLQIKYLSEIKNKVLKYSWLLLILVTFTLGCIPFFLKYVPQDWFIN